MRNLIILLIISILTSCQEAKIMRVGNGFLDEAGTYHLNNQKRVLIKNIDDSGKIFAVTNKKGKVLFQQPLNLAFSDSHYWVMYADEYTNIYFYNSDYSEQKALIWEPKTEKYIEIDFCIEKVKLPEAFEEEIKKQNAIKHCKSVN